ncbi:hypothetical protein CERZMDRAFT_43176 [Cercospora zeae-maydis SCOH1-5]|uniref:Dicer-like protein 2 n=1 Tax=Cercospora zeae-maydis SCOH1-5 TaxID=717836 RepID=A0A6A6FDT6_9PEZI|nr:hypothetical protein CERZMDRAFT_43176 [Cercospora zeae-maydis SCOH1-5]
MPPPSAASHDVAFKLRSYQQEMLQLSLEKNIIVAMDTGSGKTHIAVARIRAELERVTGDDLIWFLTPSRTLAEQQCQVLNTELSAYGVRLLTGADGVDKWTDQQLWDAVFTNVRVIVATPAVLKDALVHGFVNISRLALCVFDEAHRCTKNHPMNHIMQNFYRPAQAKGERVPHILSLTASPVMSTKTGSLQTIESNLFSIAVTPKVHRAELEKYVNPPEFQTIVFQEVTHHGQPDPRDICTALSEATRSYQISHDPYVVELMEQASDKARDKLEKVLMKRDTYCLRQLRALESRAVALQDQLGVSMAQWYVSACIQKFVTQPVENSILLELNDKERAHLLAIINGIAQRVGLSSSNHAAHDLTFSDKASQLVATLQQHADATVRCIVFVEQRVQVTALAEMLRRVPELQNLYSVAAFVGTSTNTNRKVSLADLVAIKDQEHDLQAFREGRKNLMIATNVLEEGIDISACNLVICFDAPKNLVSFVQRRGRARKSNSKYLLFVSEADRAKGHKEWYALEAEMKAMYMDDTRTLIIAESSTEPQRAYEVPSTNALLTSADAKAHLYHFCSVSISESTKYVDLRPEFKSNQDPVSKFWNAEVTLPPSVHASMRHAISLRPWKNEDDAIKDAAFEAYVRLHKGGLVNDNLLPLVRNYGPEAGTEHIDQPSIAQVSERISSLREARRNSDSATKWTSSQVQLLLGGELVVEVTMWVLGRTPAMDPFDLYYNSQKTYQVRMISRNSGEVLPEDEQSVLRACTATLLSTAHSHRMLAGKDDFPVLFHSADIMNVCTADMHRAQDRDATTVLAAISQVQDAGLVRVSSQQGRSYVLHSIDQDTEELHLIAFPKRKDFLHPAVEQSAHHTAQATFKMAECRIDALPARYALLSAFLPSVLHKLETILIAQDLAETKLSKTGSWNLSLLLEAITSPAAREPSDYNRLEYLGDCILKHCTELQLMAQHLNWPEAYLSLERDRIVRNSNLAKAAIDCQLDRYILAAPFTGLKWRPPYVSDMREPGTREMSTKTLADVVEAIIGAAYVAGGLENAFCCTQMLLSHEVWHGRDQCIEVLLGDLNTSPITNLAPLEAIIGHTFKHSSLLVEAVTHISFPFNRTGLSYERLEFLGDSVLDMVVTPKLFAHTRKLKHWQLHSIHAALVNGHFLGFCCLQHSICDETFQVVSNGSGVFQATEQEREVHLYDFLRAAPQLNKDKNATAVKYQEHKERIVQALLKGDEYPWVELVTLSPPKFFCDLVEATLGAIFIDTRGSLEACEAFVERIGVLRVMRRILDDDVSCVSPKEMLGVLADRDEVRYTSRINDDEDGNKAWQCFVKVGEEELATVGDCASKEEAEIKVAHMACKILRARGTERAGNKKRKLGGLDSC